MPPTAHINHHLGLKTNKKIRGLFALFHANIFRAKACREHSNFLKVNAPDTAPLAQRVLQRNDGYSKVLTQKADQEPFAQVQLRAF